MSNRSKFKVVAINKSAKGVYQMECTQTVNTSVQETMTEEQALGILNQGDDRFNSPKERHIWKKVTPEFLKNHFNLDVDKLSYEVLDNGNFKAKVDIEEPLVNGMYCSIQIVECVESDLGEHTNAEDVLYKQSNKATTAKRYVDSKTGETMYFSKNGELVFSFGKIFFAKDPSLEPTHTLVKDATIVSHSSVFGTMSKITDSLKTI